MKPASSFSKFTALFYKQVRGVPGPVADGGTLNLERYASGSEKPFDGIVRQENHLPNHLILSDWRLKSMKAADFSELVDLIQELLSLGFPIYISVGYRFIQINEHNLQDILCAKTFEQSIFLPKNFLLKQFSTFYKDVAVDRMVVLDDHLINQLKADDPHLEHQLNLSDLMNLKSDAEIQKVIQDFFIEGRNGGSDRKFNINAYSSRANKIFEKAKNYLLNNRFSEENIKALIVKQYEHVTLLEEPQETIHYSQVVSLKVDEEDWENSDFSSQLNGVILQSLKSLQLKIAALNSLSSILEKTTTVENLELDLSLIHDSKMPEIVLLDSSKLKFVKHLKLKKVSPALCTKIIAACPNLESLTLESCGDVFKEDSLPLQIDFSNNTKIKSIQSQESHIEISGNLDMESLSFKRSKISSNRPVVLKTNSLMLSDSKGIKNIQFESGESLGIFDQTRECKLLSDLVGIQEKDSQSLILKNVTFKDEEHFVHFFQKIKNCVFFDFSSIYNQVFLWREISSFPDLSNLKQIKWTFSENFSEFLMAKNILGHAASVESLDFSNSDLVGDLPIPDSVKTLKLRAVKRVEDKFLNSVLEKGIETIDLSDASIDVINAFLQKMLPKIQQGDFRVKNLLIESNKGIDEKYSRLVSQMNQLIKEKQFSSVKVYASDFKGQEPTKKFKISELPKETLPAVVMPSEGYLVSQNIPYILSEVEYEEEVIFYHSYSKIRVKKKENGFECYHNDEMSPEEVGFTSIEGYISKKIGDYFLINKNMPLDDNFPFSKDFFDNGGWKLISESQNFDRIVSILLEKYMNDKEFEDFHLKYVEKNAELLLDIFNNKIIDDSLKKSLSILFSKSQDLKNLFSTQIDHDLGLTNDNASQVKASVFSDQLNAPQMTEFPRIETASEENEDFLKALLRLKRINVYEDYFSKSFDSNVFSSELKFWQEAFRVPHKSLLVDVSSTAEKFSLLKILNEQIHRPIFYVRTAKDLECLGKYFTKNPDDNRWRKGASEQFGGQLVDFLKNNKNQQAIIVIDYSQFSDTEAIQYNTLMDDHRNIHGFPLDLDVEVVGIRDLSNPNIYRGNDFSSRFDKKMEPKIQNLNGIPSLPPVIDQIPNDSFVIDLYHSEDWESILFGKFSVDFSDNNIDNLCFIFKHGKLQEAISLGKAIHFLNAPWDNEAFVLAWNELLSIGYRLKNGETIKLQENQVITSSEEYHFEDIIRNFDESETVRILNPQSVPSFFAKTFVDDQGKIQHSEGWIHEAQQSKKLQVWISSEISSGDLSRILNECREKGVSLSLKVSPNLHLPDEISQIDLAQETIEKLGPTFFYSEDRDLFVHQCQSEDTFVLDISGESSFHALCRKISPAENGFLVEEGALITAIRNNKNVILTGDFSKEFMDSFFIWMFEHSNETAIYQNLTFVSENKENFRSVNYNNHEIQINDKKAAFSEQEQQILNEKQCDWNKPISTLRARLAYFQSNPENNDSDLAWLGIERLPIEALQIDEKYSFNSGENKAFCEAYFNEFFAKVHHHLVVSPFVLLTGASGVGKTTFVQKELINRLKLSNQNAELFEGDAKLGQWLKAPADNGLAILFLDEVNLSGRTWSELEGLFNLPPRVFFENQWHTLGAHHKVVFAGNPNSYGNSRASIPFFQRHGGAVLCRPLPFSVVVGDILEPAFEHSDMSAEQKQAAIELILSVYRQICAYTKEDVLISPRELQMMALEIVKSPESDVQNICWEIGRSVLKRKADMAHFDSQFKPKKLPEKQERQLLNGQFLLTDSRFSVCQKLEKRLALREWRVQQSATLNDVESYGGLGGIILEGSPGSGKSELLINLLLSKGYVEAKGSSNNINCFYKISAGLSEAKKIEILTKAFHAGAVVVWDEMNTSASPEMERLLNAIAMGRMLDGTRPQRKGFTLFATQNPMRIGARYQASHALNRRFLTIQIPDYTQKEALAIATQKMPFPEMAQEILEAYDRCKSKLNLCFRDFMKTLNAIQSRIETRLNEQKSLNTPKASTTGWTRSSRRRWISSITFGLLLSVGGALVGSALSMPLVVLGGLILSGVLFVSLVSVFILSWKNKIEPVSTVAFLAAHNEVDDLLAQVKRAGCDYIKKTLTQGLDALRVACLDCGLIKPSVIRAGAPQALMVPRGAAALNPVVDRTDLPLGLPPNRMY